MRRPVIRSTPLRIAVILGAAFLLFLLLSGVAAVVLIHQELDERVEQQVAQTFAIVTQSYGDGDLADLVDSVRAHSEANRDRDRVFFLQGADGAVLAGNIRVAPRLSGAATVDPHALGLGEDNAYHVRAQEIGGNYLLIGESSFENDEVSAIVLRSLGLAGGIFTLLIMAVGLAIAVSGQQRLDGIAGTMAAVGGGDLAARIPVGRSGDDIDDLSRQINAALDRLAKVVEGMRQVSVDIAHELKSPLNRLSLIVQSASRAVELGEPAAPLLDQADEEIRQLNGIFDALLRIAQIEAGARRARFAPTSLADILETLSDAYAGVAEEHGQRLDPFRIDPQLPKVMGDRDLLTQLFANLIENAIRHSPAGTTISVEAKAGAPGAIVIVADDGPGIPGPERMRVFQRLYRLEKSRTTAGSGLGLSLVKAIVELHRGSVSLEDNKPGARFIVSFPV